MGTERIVKELKEMKNHITEESERRIPAAEMERGDSIREG